MELQQAIAKNRAYHEAVRILESAAREAFASIEDGKKATAIYNKLGRAIKSLSVNGRIQ